MTNPAGTEARLEDVLHELSMASASPGADLLDQFIRRYPQYARELTDFAVDLAIDALRPGEDDVPTPADVEISPAVATALSRLQDRLHSVKKRRTQEAAEVPSQDPFSRLSREALRAFADAIHANVPFVLKLRDRHIRPETIPAGLYRLAAQHLNVPEAVMVAYSAGRPQMPHANRYKSDRKPEATSQQSFAEAVAGSNLSEEQQRFLLALGS
jgi:hypothetical protein